MTSLIFIRWCRTSAPATITGISVHAGLDAARLAIIQMQTDHPDIRPDIRDPKEKKAGGYQIPSDSLPSQILKRLSEQGNLYFPRDPETGIIKDTQYTTHIVPLFEKAGGMKNFPLAVIDTEPQRKERSLFSPAP
jgi:hypothetical protein